MSGRGIAPPEAAARPGDRAAFRGFARRPPTRFRSSRDFHGVPTRGGTFSARDRPAHGAPRVALERVPRGRGTEGGSGFFVDGNGVVEPLVERAERDEIGITHVLVTHSHADHVDGVHELAERFGAPPSSHTRPPLESSAPSRSPTARASSQARFGWRRSTRPATAATTWRSSSTGRTASRLTCSSRAPWAAPAAAASRRSGRRSWSACCGSIRRPASIPGTRSRRRSARVGVEPLHPNLARARPEGSEPCRVRGEEATLVLWAPDYDGGHKAWVRYPDGRDAIVGGSQVERS